MCIHKLNNYILRVFSLGFAFVKRIAFTFCIIIFNMNTLSSVQYITQVSWTIDKLQHFLVLFVVHLTCHFECAEGSVYFEFVLFLYAYDGSLSLDVSVKVHIHLILLSFIYRSPPTLILHKECFESLIFISEDGMSLPCFGNKNMTSLK